ncbi:hypothetical protein F4823DRAFT_594729 [Ustulina deusta]|nr:hypothetical protein F4823DRAFT_594729 [Ustulina deusta]
MASIYSVSSYNADLEPAGQITSGKSIHETFVRCLDLYRSLTFQILDKENSETGVEDEVDLNRLMDEFGRLRIWGEQTKASLAPKARASLDDFLRNEERLNKEVKEVLAQLGTQLSLAVSVVKETGQQHSALDGNISDGMVSDSDYSSENGSEESIDRGNERPKVSKLSIIVSHIFEHIQLLYHFGSLLRRPGLKGRYLRHNDSNNLDTATLFDTWHIEEKLRQWSRQAGEGIIVSPKEEDAVTVQKISEREAGESPKSLHYVLSRRFAKANAQRREQLKYWTNHPYQLRRPQEPKMNMTKGKALKSAIQKRPKKGDASTEDDVSTIKPESKGPKSEKSRSTTAVSFSTVAESALLESGTETGKARTIYAESVVAGKWSARVPPPPKRTTAIDGPEQYECPYCHMNLDSELVNHRLAWKRHVFRDLRPYSCTFADCSNPNKLYTTRHEWKYHEMQIHRRSWICHECNLGFEEKHELVQHLHESHPGNWTDRQLSIILEMSERPMEESIILPCSLCKSELSLAKLLDHLAAHMEEISLFVLPNDSEFDDDTNSNNVMGTDTQESGDKRETSPLSSLRFSDIAQSDRDALEGEGLIPFFQSPTASRSDGINLVTNEETGSYTSVPSLDSILDKLLGVAHNTTAEPTPLSRLEIRYLCAEAKEIFMSQYAAMYEGNLVTCYDYLSPVDSLQKQTTCLWVTTLVESRMQQPYASSSHTR